MFNSLSNLLFSPFGLSAPQEIMAPPSLAGDSIADEHTVLPEEEYAGWLNIEGEPDANKEDHIETTTDHSYESSSSSHTSEPTTPPILNLQKPKRKEKKEEEQLEKKHKLDPRKAALFWSQKPLSVKVPPQQQQKSGSGKFNTTMSHSRKSVKV